MDFITAEQFLEQPKEVQKVLLKWWKPEIGERIFSTGISSGTFIMLKEYENYFSVALIELSDLRDFSIRKVAKNVFIPLFAETQLRHFIEEKAGYIELQYWPFGYDLWVCYKDSGDMRIRHQLDTHDLLQAYWQVACEVANGKS